MYQEANRPERQPGSRTIQVNELFQLFNPTSAVKMSKSFPGDASNTLHNNYYETIGLRLPGFPTMPMHLHAYMSNTSKQSIFLHQLHEGYKFSIDDKVWERREQKLDQAEKIKVSASQSGPALKAKILFKDLVQFGLAQQTDDDLYPYICNPELLTALKRLKLQIPTTYGAIYANAFIDNTLGVIEFRNFYPDDLGATSSDPRISLPVGFGDGNAVFLGPTDQDVANVWGRFVLAPEETSPDEKGTTANS